MPSPSPLPDYLTLIDFDDIADGQGYGVVSLPTGFYGNTYRGLLWGADPAAEFVAGYAWLATKAGNQGTSLPVPSAPYAASGFIARAQYYVRAVFPATTIFDLVQVRCGAPATPPSDGATRGPSPQRAPPLNGCTYLQKWLLSGCM